MIAGVNFQSLFAHQAWADAALLAAVRAHPPTREDEWMKKTLHHIVVVQRYFFSLFYDRSFDNAIESIPPESFEKLVALYRTTHEEELAYVAGLDGEALERRFELPFLKTEFAVADGLTQVVMHSQNHRGQCLRYLRKHGGAAPTLDYILWAKDRPAPEWPPVA